ncbi:MAG: hypothetical protein JWL73_334 [Actinomycetia bacterium]|nr:hypothetical protein [Actinomycetes bacterium]
MEPASTDRIKLHLHRVEVASGTLNVLTPRPSSPLRFATRERDGGYAIVSDLPGARFLARLVWAAAFQQRARTVVLVDGVSLSADPADGGSSLPILIANDALVVPTPIDGAQLARARPFAGPAPGSVRLVTHGLDRALADPKRYLDEWRVETEGSGSRHRHRFVETGGLLMLAAPAAVLRRWAFDAARMVRGLEGDSDAGPPRAERSESAQLHVVPALWDDGPVLETDDLPVEPALPTVSAPHAEPGADGPRRVLWQAPTEARNA